jgi:hypothetical protein
MRSRRLLVFLAPTLVACAPGEPPLATRTSSKSLVTNETWTEREKLVANDDINGDFFGIHVAMQEKTAVVSAHWDMPNGELQAGAAHVFSRENGSWTARQKLTQDVPEFHAWFGRAVALDGDTVLVGAPYAATAQGAAYTFVDDGTSFTQQQKLFRSDPQPDSGFGQALDVSGDRCIVGALDDEDGGLRSGAAYVFRNEAGTWVEEQKLFATDPAVDRQLGASVDIDGSTLVVGAPGTGSSPSTLAGAAYVFQRAGTSWSGQKLVIPDGKAADRFGDAVAIDGDTVVVGAPGDEETTIGAVYVFQKNGTTFELAQTLAPTDGEAGDYFGGAVSVDDDRLLVGAYRDDGVGEDSGAVFVHVRDNGSWSEKQKLVPSDPAALDLFGVSVSLDGTGAMIGGGRYTEGSGYAFLALGATCTSADDCGSDACVDGVCCDTDCTETCEACNVAGALGACSPVPVGEPDDTCAGQCDGNGACALDSAQACNDGNECLSGFCASNVCCNEACTAACASCSLPGSEGTCTQNDCGPYGCDGIGGCLTSCTSTANCAQGHACNANQQCVPAPKTSNREEDSGCGCRMVGDESRAGSLAALLLFALSMVRAAPRVRRSRSQTSK